MRRVTIRGEAKQHKLAPCLPIPIRNPLPFRAPPLPPDRNRGRPGSLGLGSGLGAAPASGRDRRTARPGGEGVAQGFDHAREPRRGDRGERTRDPGFELARASDARKPPDLRRDLGLRCDGAARRHRRGGGADALRRSGRSLPRGAAFAPADLSRDLGRSLGHGAHQGHCRPGRNRRRRPIALAAYAHQQVEARGLVRARRHAGARSA